MTRTSKSDLELIGSLEETIRMLKSDIVRKDQHHEAIVELHAIVRKERDAAKAALEESREHFSGMKLQLLNAEKAIARFEGYIDRVKEDDNARDGFDVIKQDRDVIVPRRTPERPIPTASITGADLSSMRRGGVGPTKHWTEY